MRARSATFAVGLAVVLAACGGGTDAATTTTAGESLPGSPATTSVQPPADSGSVDTTTTTVGGSTSTTVAPLVSDFDGDPAPDFTLALADGSSYTLSSGSLPLYMVFWAEW